MSTSRSHPNAGSIHRYQALTTLADLKREPHPEPFALIEIGREAAQNAIVPGALRLTIDDFSGEEGPGTGNRPLPSHEAIVAKLKGAGITADVPVVVYSETPRDLAGAARAWVVLRWAGVRRVTYLNDAHAADLLAVAPALPLRNDASPAPDAQFTIDPNVIVDAAAVAARPERVLLIDARAAEHFGDETQHIPGAVSLPSSLLAAEGRVHDPARLLTAYREAISVDPYAQPVITYCGSGVSAAVQALALGALGIDAPVYIGSWSEWSKHPPYTAEVIAGPQ